MEHTCLVDILLDDRREVCGVLLNNDGYILVDTANVVIATGGIGQIYEYSTNPTVATGDGLGAAIRCGARLRTWNSFSFIPQGSTVRRGKAVFSDFRAVRGDGGKLIMPKANSL